MEDRLSAVVLSLWLACAAAAMPAQAEVVPGSGAALDFPPQLTGVVLDVDDKARLTVFTDLSLRDGRRTIQFRLWRSAIEPDLLRVLTLGRTIRCEVAYLDGDELVGPCSVVLYPTRPAGVSLGRLAENHGLGDTTCTDAEQKAVSAGRVNPFFGCAQGPEQDP